ncbi:putative germin-like protein 2-1 [Vitis vinifera]|uniref:Germin-like protein n=1 Tax=Vitis vinifera TaxID=29760 RepID=A0A438IN48_VITVI|nr:putative germin-like protein 2-1 [Vitis vinifera]
MAFSVASASDPSPLQDFCVAVNDTNDTGKILMLSLVFSSMYIDLSKATLVLIYLLLCSFVNGKFCRDPKLATPNDFSFQGFVFQGIHQTNLVDGHTSKRGTDTWTNTLGVSLARVDYAPYGLNPPHIHPRATEILTVLEGTLYVGFVTSNPENRLISKVLYKGDVFVFPQGLIHFQLNVGTTNAVAIASLSSQNPGVITIAKAVFGSNPAISADVLTKAFQVDKNVVEYLQSQF